MVHDTIDEVVKHYMQQVKRGQELLEILFDDSKWMFNALTGADIHDYNTPANKSLAGEDLARFHREKTPDPLQPVMDQAVLEINTQVVAWNKQNWVLTPYTATYVHRQYDHAYHHSYQYTRNGCHLTSEGKKYWAKQILKSIQKTRQMSQPKVHSP